MELIIALIVLLLYAIIFWGIFDKVSICEKLRVARERIKREEGRKVEGTKSLSETNGELVELVKI